MPRQHSALKVRMGAPGFVVLVRNVAVGQAPAKVQAPRDAAGAHNTCMGRRAPRLARIAGPASHIMTPVLA